MSDQALHHRGRDRKPFAVKDFRVATHEVVDERRNFLHALTQRRNGDLNDVEAVVKILAEAPFRQGTLEVLVGRGKDPDIHFQRGLASHP